MFIVRCFYGEYYPVLFITDRFNCMRMLHTHRVVCIIFDNCLRNKHHIILLNNTTRKTLMLVLPQLTVITLLLYTYIILCYVPRVSLLFNTSEYTRITVYVFIYSALFTYLHLCIHVLQFLIVAILAVSRYTTGKVLYASHVYVRSTLTYTRCYLIISYINVHQLLKHGFTILQTVKKYGL